MQKPISQLLKERILMAVNCGFVSQTQYNKLLDNYAQICFMRLENEHKIRLLTEIERLTRKPEKKA